MQETAHMSATLSITVDLAEGEGRVEKLAGKESGEAALRFSGRPSGQSQPGPLTLTEAELIRMLHEAIHAGILSDHFIGDLHAEIEI